MTIKGVLFDFSGTLFRIESTESWLRTTSERAGVPLDGDRTASLARQLADAGAQPGGPAPTVVPADLAEVWAGRDSSTEQHRAAYTGMARRVPLPDPGLYDALYARHMEPAAWRPYADAAGVLAGLRRRGVRTGVVSNIGWDLRPVFREHGLDAWVDAYVLSCEHGLQKPDPRLFRTACEALGLPPEEVVMVGDDRRADAGAAAVGCEVFLVDHLPVEERPGGLLPVLDLVG
ncbi:putative hydrolase of the HAD superfamily [Streptomyces olivoverticillatus]|uniref:Putative hydrolase of the HAD superfamily n=1 Tax=Streptomyces olivoverticillatus TaxID=66427 RepID=A0A7W7LNZ0_9ACTN|nr:HAD-IA family hydrolase [Streptomyces olivoverticillatus]MBB4893754.1 putative hydrolase of the HAD superfamily [Streptomyces olivoverticillatus]